MTIEAPTTPSDAADLLADAGGSILIRGGGSKLDWGGRVEDPDLIVDTTAMSGLLTHNAADMTASVRAGTPLQTLQAYLADSGQWLAIDPPAAARGATIAGLMATGDSGPSRLSYGGMRDLVIGVTLVLVDGTIARSGGHVIKNVAGYDLAKLMNGSLGTLALIAEVVLRLHPRPQSSVTVAGLADVEQAAAASAALTASPLGPSAVEWIGESQDLLVRLDGSAAHVEAASAEAITLLREHGVDADVLEPDVAASTWKSHTDAVQGRQGESVARICGLPSDLPSVAAAATRLSGDHALDVALASSPALGIHTVRFSGADARGHAAAMSDLRDHVQHQGASVLLRSRPPEVDTHLDALGEPPSTLAVLRRIKAAFDPAARLAPGRFGGWY